MGTEIERKQLICEDSVEYLCPALTEMGYNNIEELKSDIVKNGKRIVQGYIVDKTISAELISDLGLKLEFTPEEVRLRRTNSKNMGIEYLLTLKGKGSEERPEKNEDVSQVIFQSYWDYTTENRISKIRLTRNFEGYDYEFDLYTDREDLLIVETEVKTIDELEKVKILGRDVTKIDKYKNKNLAKRAFD